MRNSKWLTPLLSVLILAIAIAIAIALASTYPALYLTATTTFQSFCANMPLGRGFRGGFFQRGGFSGRGGGRFGRSSHDDTLAPSSASPSTSTYAPTADSMGSTTSQPSSTSTTTEPPAYSESKVSSTAEPAPAALPKLSAADYRTYNRLAAMMDAYHNRFRHTWNQLYKKCESGSAPTGLSRRAFISQGLHLCHTLTIHHTIEERHIFPELAERMPAFAPQDHLISQHEMIHEGLEKLEEYLDACKSGKRELRMDELKKVMDGFGEVLWSHLDDEVRMLGAENMRQYWTKEEILRMNW